MTTIEQPMQQPTQQGTIAGTIAGRWFGFGKDRKFLYVEDVKDKLSNGSTFDWAYTSKPQNAMPLSKEWLDMFVSDMKAVGAEYKVLWSITIRVI